MVENGVFFGRLRETSTTCSRRRSAARDECCRCHSVAAELFRADEGDKIGGRAAWHGSHDDDAPRGHLERDLRGEAPHGRGDLTPDRVLHAAGVVLDRAREAQLDRCNPCIHEAFGTTGTKRCMPDVFATQR